MTMAWINPNAILRDLCVAQGGGVVPDELEALGAEDKPPSFNYTEETEEEFFKDISGYSETKPQLHLIKQMIQLANIDNEDDNNESSNSTALETSNLDLLAKQSAPQMTKGKPRMRNPRNAVVQSFLQDNEKQTHLKTPSYYLNDIKTKLESNENNILNTNNTSECKTNEVKVKSPPHLDMVMFKKKSVSPVAKVETVTEKKKEEIKLTSQCKAYVPSSYASSYYQKCVERSKMKEMVNMDIWTKAEKKMKEIDEKLLSSRKSEAEEVKAAAVNAVQPTVMESVQPTMMDRAQLSMMESIHLTETESIQPAVMDNVQSSVTESVQPFVTESIHLTPNQTSFLENTEKCNLTSTIKINSLSSHSEI